MKPSGPGLLLAGRFLIIVSISVLVMGYIKAESCHPAYLTFMQSVSCEILGWINHKLESRLLGEISTTSDMQMVPL